MISELSDFVSEKRAMGIPWSHIANMAGTSIENLRPFMEMSRAAVASAKPQEPDREEKQPRGRKPEGELSQKDMILVVLSQGEATVSSIKYELGVRGSRIASRLMELCKQDLAVVLRPRYAKGAALYAITQSGRDSIANNEKAKEFLERPRSRGYGIPPSVTAIVNEIAHKHGIGPDVLTGRRRFKHLIIPRQELFAEIRDRIRIADAPPSYPQIGAWLGFDHTTVLHGDQRHRERKKAEKAE